MLNTSFAVVLRSASFCLSFAAFRALSAAFFFSKITLSRVFRWWRNSDSYMSTVYSYHLRRTQYYLHIVLCALRLPHLPSAFSGFPSVSFPPFRFFWPFVLRLQLFWLVPRRSVISGGKREWVLFCHKWSVPIFSVRFKNTPFYLGLIYSREGFPKRILPLNYHPTLPTLSFSSVLSF